MSNSKDKNEYEKRRIYREYSDEDFKKKHSEYAKKEAEKLENAKKKREKEKRKRKILSIVLLLAFLIAAVIIFLNTPLFRIKTIEIWGNENVLYQSIITSSKMEVGDNIFKHGEKRIEKQIEKLPYVSKADVKKEYPSKLIITITEEKEKYYFDFGTELISADKNGKSIGIIKEIDKEGLIAIKGGEKGEFALGEYVVLKEAEATETLERLLLVINEYELYNVTELDVTLKDDISFYIDGNLKVKFGSLGTDDELYYKMAYVKEVIGNLPGKIRGVIDATNLDYGISYRPQETTPIEEEPIEEPIKEEGEEVENLTPEE